MHIGRVIALLAGTVLTLIGLMVSVLSVPALIVVGFDDTLDTGTQRLASPTAAIASAEASLGDETLPDRKRSAEETWDLRLRAAAAEGQELFVGIGPAEEVDAYLDRVAWDKVSVFAYERFSTDATRVDFERLGAAGDPSDLPAPADQDFWTVSDTGTDVSLDWDYREGHHTVVLMNADGSTGVAADGAVRLEIPKLGLILAAVAGAGLVTLLVGLVILLLALRALRSARRHPTPDPVAAAPVPAEPLPATESAPTTAADPAPTAPEPAPSALPSPAAAAEPATQARPADE